MTVDGHLLVIGAGAGGMTAALVAALEGLRVMLCEASEQAGGTTATSAGTPWLPGNRHGRNGGHADSVDEVARYLDAMTGPDHTRQRRRAFLDSGDKALEQRTAVRFASARIRLPIREVTVLRGMMVRKAGILATPPASVPSARHPRSSAAA